MLEDEFARRCDRSLELVLSGSTVRRQPSVSARSTSRSAWLGASALTVAVLLGILSVIGLEGWTGESVPLKRGDLLTEQGGNNQEWSAFGRVISNSGATRFCLLLPTALVYSSRTAPAPCALGIPAVGVSPSELSGVSYTAHGFSGDGRLTGVVRDGTLFVTTTAPGPAEDVQREFTTAVPCSPPSGGWARTSTSIDSKVAERYAATHASYVPALALVHPTLDTHIIEVVTNGLTTKALEDLAKSYPANELCVARTRFASEALATVQKDPTLQTGMNGIFASGVMSVGSNGELEYRIEALIETPELRQALSKYPSGLISLHTWLGPAT